MMEQQQYRMPCGWCGKIPHMVVSEEGNSQGWPGIKYLANEDLDSGAIETVCAFYNLCPACEQVSIWLAGSFVDESPERRTARSFLCHEKFKGIGGWEASMLWSDIDLLLDAKEKLGKQMSEEELDRFLPLLERKQWDQSIIYEGRRRARIRANRRANSPDKREETQLFWDEDTWNKIWKILSEPFHIFKGKHPSCLEFTMERFFLVYPRLTGTLPPEAEPEMPQSMRRNYDEAKDIFAQSPRGAAALLRLAVQNLCIHLKNHRPHLKLKGRNLKEDIAILQKKGLPENIVNALDVVRVIGNNAIHPGQMDAEDDRERVEKLFRVVNHIVRWTISDHNLVDDMHKDLPEALRRVLKGKGKGKPGSDDSKPPNPENP